MVRYNHDKLIAAIKRDYPQWDDAAVDEYANHAKYVDEQLQEVLDSWIENGSIMYDFKYDDITLKDIIYRFPEIEFWPFLNAISIMSKFMNSPEEASKFKELMDTRREVPEAI